MRLEFHPEALAEYEDAAQHYAGCQKDLEIRFIAAIEAVLDQIAKNPEWGIILEDDIRRWLARIFPYAVLYSIESDYLLIIAVMHCHREPGYWRYRLKTKA